MLLKNLMNKNLAFILLLFIISFSVRLLLIPKIPLQGDEAVYAQIIDEFIKKPTLLPAFLGHVISWKPPLTFIVYSIFIRIFNIIIPGAPVELTYRLPSLIFGVLSVLTFYFLVKKLCDEELAFVSALVFSLFPVFLFTNSFLLLDNFLVFLIILSLLFYVEGERNKRYFYYGGFVLGLAFWTKTFISFMVLPILTAYYYEHKKILFSKEFLCSMLILPLSALIYTLLFYTASPTGYDIFSSYLYDFSRIGTATSQLSDAVVDFIFSLSPWIFVAIFSAFRINYGKRENRMMLVWSLFAFLTISVPGFFWYYVSVIPAIAFLSARTILSLNNRNYVYLILFVFLYVSLASYPLLKTGYTSNPAIIYSEKQAGQFLQNESGILILSDQGLPSLIFYKFHAEEKPNFTGVNMTITERNDALGYVVYDTVDDQVKHPEKKVVVTENATSIKNAILESSVNSYVVLDRATYETLLSDFPQDYKIALNLIDDDIIILKRVR